MRSLRPSAPWPSSAAVACKQLALIECYCHAFFPVSHQHSCINAMDALVQCLQGGQAETPRLRALRQSLPLVPGQPLGFGQVLGPLRRSWGSGSCLPADAAPRRCPLLGYCVSCLAFCNRAGTQDELLRNFFLACLINPAICFCQVQRAATTAQRLDSSEMLCRPQLILSASLRAGQAQSH